MPIGTCALCKSIGVEIRNSHLLAAAFYRRVRGSGGNPVLVTKRSTVETSEQVRAHLLCDVCEQRFKTREDWVISACWKGPDDFPLFESLAVAPTLSQEGESDRGYAGRAVPEARIDDVVYFAASVFWRAGARRWPQREYHSQIVLGPYLEPLRRFLIGAGAWPQRVTLHVMLSGDSSDRSNDAFALPYQAGREGYRLYRFEVPGISFVMLVGGAIPAEVLDFCTARSGIAISGASVDNIRLKAVFSVLKTAKPKGAVAKRWT